MAKRSTRIEGIPAKTGSITCEVLIGMGELINHFNGGMVLSLVQNPQNRSPLPRHFQAGLRATIHQIGHVSFFHIHIIRSPRIT